MRASGAVLVVLAALAVYAQSRRFEGVTLGGQVVLWLVGTMRSPSSERLQAASRQVSQPWRILLVKALSIAAVVFVHCLKRVAPG